MIISKLFWCKLLIKKKKKDWYFKFFLVFCQFLVYNNTFPKNKKTKETENEWVSNKFRIASLESQIAARWGVFSTLGTTVLKENHILVCDTDMGRIEVMLSESEHKFSSFFHQIVQLHSSITQM